MTRGKISCLDLFWMVLQSIQREKTMREILASAKAAQKTATFCLDQFCPSTETSMAWTEYDNQNYPALRDFT